jgi:hypothetical protein
MIGGVGEGRFALVSANGTVTVSFFAWSRHTGERKRSVVEGPAVSLEERTDAEKLRIGWDTIRSFSLLGR